MGYLTAKDLREKLALVPDDTRVSIRAKTCDGDNLYFDLEYDTMDDKFLGGICYLRSEGLDLTIEADMENIRLGEY